jgi:hypothetical protein
MKQYVIDQLRETDYEQILEHLNACTERTLLEGIYWVMLPEDLYSNLQLEHAQCQPHYFALSLDQNSLSAELLIRSRQIIRCSCIAYATPEQRDYIIHFMDNILETLNIRV